MTATDAAGNVSAAGTQTLTIDSTAPTVAITDDTGGDSAVNGDITFTFTFSEAISGFLAEDITVANGTKGAFSQTSDTVYTLVVTPDANSTSAVTVDVAANKATDTAGNNNTAATQATQAVDTAAPSAPTISSITTPNSDNTPTLSISAEASSTVKVYANGDLLGTATEDSSGSFSYTPSALPDGSYSFTVTATDSTGNVSAEATPQIVEIDAVKAGVPVISSSSTTTDTTPTISGTAEVGSTVTAVVALSLIHI